MPILQAYTLSGTTTGNGATQQLASVGPWENGWIQIIGCELFSNDGGCFDAFVSNDYYPPQGQPYNIMISLGTSIIINPAAPQNIVNNSNAHFFPDGHYFLFPGKLVPNNNPTNFINLNARTFNDGVPLSMKCTLYYYQQVTS